MQLLQAAAAGFVLLIKKVPAAKQHLQCSCACSLKGEGLQGDQAGCKPDPQQRSPYALKALLWSSWVGRPRLEDVRVSQGGRLQHGQAARERCTEQQRLSRARQAAGDDAQLRLKGLLQQPVRLVQHKEPDLPEALCQALICGEQVLRTRMGPLKFQAEASGSH